MGECIIAKTGMVPNTRTINGLPLSEDITINDTHIMAGNGVAFDTLRNVLTNCTIHTMSTQVNTDVINDPNYPYPYEVLVNASVSTSIGLVNNGNWWVVKYFRNSENTGYGIQLALNHVTGIMCVRAANGAAWGAWQTVYTTGNLNPGAIGAAAASHGHLDTEISASDGTIELSLRDILTNRVVKHLHRPGATVLNNPNYPYPYDASVANYDSPSIGLSGWWHIKYFRHIDSNGYGAQLALGLDTGNRMLFRTSNGTNWNPWQEVYHNGNLNPANYALANHTHDITALGGGKIISGSYTGQYQSYVYDGKNNYYAFTRFINLGVTPKAIIIMKKGYDTFHASGYDYVTGGLATINSPAKYINGSITREIITIGTNGFTVREESIPNGNWAIYLNLDTKDDFYNYIAFI